MTKSKSKSDNTVELISAEQQIDMSIRNILHHLPVLNREWRRLDREIEKAFDRDDSKAERRLLREQAQLEKVFDKIDALRFKTAGI